MSRRMNEVRAAIKADAARLLGPAMKAEAAKAEARIRETSTETRYLVLIRHPANADGAPTGKLIEAPYPHPEIAMDRAVQELTDRTTPLGPGCYVWVIPWVEVDQWVQPAMEGEPPEPLPDAARTLPGSWPAETPPDDEGNGHHEGG